MAVQVSVDKGRQVMTHLGGAAERATCVYALVYSGRLLVGNKDYLPVPPANPEQSENMGLAHFR
jgi:hypothetical protein